ncbi:30S ribosomal protein S20, partial [Arthrospira platensis SPKY1]|nr:30S ribosomal protein S20 [Arthrospira platensis SPKY1]
MPNIKSAIKRMRSNETKRQRNLDLRSEVKTAIKKVRTAVEKNDLEAAKLLLQDAYASLDKAAKKNVIHANNASRRKA